MRRLLAILAVMLWAGCAVSPEAARTTRRALVDRPLTIAGGTLEGGTFTTAQWKGKVVGVLFWASWCSDSKEALPDVVKLYQRYHAQGLEMVGISSDKSAGDLRAFLARNPDLAWPELYTWPGWSRRHPLNARYGVDWIPTLFIMDRHGVCRSVDGIKDMEVLVPKLLAESGG